LVAGGEVGPQFLRQLGVAGKELLPVDGLPTVQALHVLAQHFLQRVLPRGLRGGGRGHGSLLVGVMPSVRVAGRVAGGGRGQGGATDSWEAISGPPQNLRGGWVRIS